MSIEFADPFPALWAPQAPQKNVIGPCSPHDVVTTDMAKPNLQQSSVCLESHPKLQFLNEIQLQFRGQVGRRNTDNYLTEMPPSGKEMPPAPQAGVRVRKR